MPNPVSAVLAAIEAALPLADVVKVNEKELGMLERSPDPQEACRALAGRGPALGVATLGPRGSVFATLSAGGRAAGFRVKAVDATGCGDAEAVAVVA